MSGCLSIVVLDVTFVCVFRNTNAQSEMQLLSTGFSCRCWNAGSLLEGDSCWQSEAQLASGSPHVERRIATCHGHICRSSGHIFPGEQQMQALYTHRFKGTHTRNRTLQRVTCVDLYYVLTVFTDTENKLGVC